MAFVLPLELECREKLYGHPTFLLYSDVLLQFQNNFLKVREDFLLDLIILIM